MTRLRKWIVYGVLALAPLFAVAQGNVTLTGVVTDSDVQAWVSAKWIAYIVGASGPLVSVCPGVTITNNVNGVLSTSGAFVSVNQLVTNQCISPPNTQWQFTLVPVADAPGGHPTQLLTPVTISTTTYAAGTYVSNNIHAPRFTSGFGGYGYTLDEAVNPQPGNTFFDVNTLTLNCYYYSAWNPCAGTGAGINQLTGDVTAGPGSGSQVATAVDLPGHIPLNGTPSAGQVPVATSPTTAAWGSASGYQYVYLPNCSSTGTTLNSWAKYAGQSVSNQCITSLTTSDYNLGAGGVSIVGIVVAGAGTTGNAKVAISGTVPCQFDSAIAITQGEYVMPSNSVNGACEAVAFTPANEDPNSNIFYALADANGSAGAVVNVDLMTIPGTYGNQTVNNAPPTLTLLASAAYGGMFGVPSLLQQSLPGTGTTSGAYLLPQVPFHFIYGNATHFTNLGQSALGASGQDFSLDLLTNGLGSPPTSMLRVNGSSYNVPDVRNINGTVSVGISGDFCIGNTGGVYVWTFTGNATTYTPICDNAGHSIAFTFEPPASGGPYTFTWPSGFINAPTVSLSAGNPAQTVSFAYDGTNYNCASGCAVDGGLFNATTNPLPSCGASNLGQRLTITDQAFVSIGFGNALTETGSQTIPVICSYPIAGVYAWIQG